MAGPSEALRFVAAGSDELFAGRKWRAKASGSEDRFFTARFEGRSQKMAKAIRYSLSE
jgi:hypothetical protein